MIWLSTEPRTNGFASPVAWITTAWADDAAKVDSPTSGEQRVRKQVPAIPIGANAGKSSIGKVDLDNPLGAGADKVAQGRALYIAMNCDGCHGLTGGGMGPNLTDVFWRYGGTPAHIYKTLYEGRSNGMPAWGEALPPSALWMLFSYIQSMGGAIPADKADEAIRGSYQGSVATKSSRSPAVGGFPLEGQ